MISKKSAKGVAETPKYGKLSFREKVAKKFRNTLAAIVAKTPFQFSIYFSYWHYRLKKGNKMKADSLRHYFTQKPDYGAGIGHQLSNWNSGYYFAKYFGLSFAHSPFSSSKWEELLGFGEGEVLAAELLNSSDFKKVQLPRFDCKSSFEVDLVRKIIGSYGRDKVLFLAEMNQQYVDQFETAKFLSKKFFDAKARRRDKLIYEKDTFNIAIHIRRQMAIETEEVWKERGLNNTYFVEILKSVLSVLETTKNYQIYLFSQGDQSAFNEFEKFDNLKYCMEMNPYDSFIHMANADLLISSKSSFSYKPALISKGIKVCPGSFWHHYPNTDDFFLADNDGHFDVASLKIRLNSTQ